MEGKRGSESERRGMKKMRERERERRRRMRSWPDAM